jgi:hypothetical protein
MPAAPARSSSCPPDILDLLPWYPDGGLTSDERGAVEAHAAECSECRREILEDVRGVVLAEDAPSADRILSRVFDQIAAGSPAETAQPSPRFATLLRAAPRRPRWQTSLAWAAAAGLAAFLATAAAIGVGRLFDSTGTVYETATAPRAQSQGESQGQSQGTGRSVGPELDVVLRDDVAAAQVRDALASLDAEIVGGPTPLGRYRVRLPAGADAANAARTLRAEGTGIAVIVVEPTP